MTSLAKYRSGSSIFDEMDSVMQTIFADVFNPEFQKQFKIGVDKASYPKTDIIDQSNKIIFEVDINRLKKDDISVEIIPSDERNVSYLTIQGGKQVNGNEDKDNRVYLKKEIKKSSWRRSWSLSEKHYNLDTVKVDVKDGLLVISIDKIVDNDLRGIKKLL